MTAENISHLTQQFMNTIHEIIEQLRSEDLTFISYVKSAQQLSTQWKKTEEERERIQNELIAVNQILTKNKRNYEMSQELIQAERQQKNIMHKEIDNMKHILKLVQDTVEEIEIPVELKKNIEDVFQHVKENVHNETDITDSNHASRSSYCSSSESRNTMSNISQMLGSNITVNNVSLYTPIILKLKGRPHQFHIPAFVLGEKCTVCCGRIKCTQTSHRCSDCKTIVHRKCRASVPLPCIPTKINSKIISIRDIVPDIKPVVPAALLHCIFQIEHRGLKTVGLYRIPGDHRTVEILKNRFFKEKGMPNLATYDVYELCTFVKEMFKMLKHKLISKELLRKLMSCYTSNDFYHAIFCMPDATKDTLSFLILHLQTIAQSTDCKMSVNNLSSIFAPILMDSEEEDNKINGIKVLRRMIKSSNDCWKSILINGL